MLSGGAVNEIVVHEAVIAAVAAVAIVAVVGTSFYANYSSLMVAKFCSRAVAQGKPVTYLQSTGIIISKLADLQFLAASWSINIPSMHILQHNIIGGGNAHQYWFDCSTLL